MKWSDDFPKIQLPSRNINPTLHPSYQTDYSGHQNGNGIRKIDEVYIVLSFVGRRLYSPVCSVLGNVSRTCGVLLVRPDAWRASSHDHFSRPHEVQACVVVV